MTNDIESAVHQAAIDAYQDAVRRYYDDDRINEEFLEASSWAAAEACTAAVMELHRQMDGENRD